MDTRAVIIYCLNIHNLREKKYMSGFNYNNKMTPVLKSCLLHLDNDQHGNDDTIWDDGMAPHPTLTPAHGVRLQ